jgi:[ribosomal protein S5]-alanine N-acetyltransferase
MDKPVELKTERLVLRPYKKSDIGDLIEITRDPEWARYQTGIPPTPYSRENAEKLLKMFCSPEKCKAVGILQVFAITLNGKLVGEIGLNQRPEEQAANMAEIIYTLSTRYWNKGYVTEAARAAVDWVFTHYPTNKLYAYCDPRNTGSWRVMEKLGMKREGQLRQHALWNGEYRDKLYYGILRNEWEQNNKDTPRKQSVQKKK